MNNKNIFSNQHIKAIELSNIFNKTKRSSIELLKSKETIFPNVSTVYSKDVVVNYQQKENSIKKPKKFISIITLDKLYQSRDRSRFNFDAVTVDPQYLIQVPEPVSDFLYINFKRSILLRKEQEDVSQYYFSQIKANDAEDSWSSLITTLDLFSSFEDDSSTQYQHNSTIKNIKVNDEVVLIDKFNSV